MAITDCKEVEDKTVKTMKIFDQASGGPEVVIEFTDGMMFVASLRSTATIEAKCYRTEGGEPSLVVDFLPSGS